SEPRGSSGAGLRHLGGDPSWGPVQDSPRGAAGLAGAGAGATGAVSWPIVGGMKTPPPPEPPPPRYEPPGTGARGLSPAIGAAVTDGSSKGGGASKANTPQTTLAWSSWPFFGCSTVSLPERCVRRSSSRNSRTSRP